MSKLGKKPRAAAELKSAMVRALRARGPLSRVQLARELQLVASTVGIHVDRLIRDGYVIESSAVRPRVGRPPSLVELNPKGGRFVGVDFDARQVMVIEVDFAQGPLNRVRRTIPTLATAETVLATIEQAIAEVLGDRRDNVLGIGLGVPGPVDAERGVALEYKFIRDWRDVEVKSRIAETFRVPVYVENNLRSMVVGEFWCGEGRGVRDLVCLGIRSGIGSGVVVGGRLVSGSRNLAGEIGRWVCPEDILPPRRDDEGPAPNRPRTIEDVASVTAMLDEAGERLARGEASSLGKPGDLPGVADLIAASDSGDPLGRSIVERAALMHGWVVHQLAQLLDPERIVVAGPLASGAYYFDTLRRAAARLAGSSFDARIARSTLGDFAGAQGAAALAFHNWMPGR